MLKNPVNPVNPVDSYTGWGFPNAATPAGSSLYYSIRLAPAPARDDLAALFGWRHAIRAVLDEVTDPGVAAAKLEWWREEIERARSGEARHPLTKRLAAVIERVDLPSEPFREVVSVYSGVLGRDFPQDQAAWIASADRDLGAVAELTARCLGRHDGESVRIARQAGTYCALIERLRDAGWLLRRGRLGILPTDQLRRAGLVPEALSRPEARAALPRLLAEAAAPIVALGADIERTDVLLPLSLRIQCRLHRLLLAELKDSDFQVLDQRIALTPIRKLWHAWRESRRS